LRGTLKRDIENNCIPHLVFCGILDPDILLVNVVPDDILRGYDPEKPVASCGRTGGTAWKYIVLMSGSDFETLSRSSLRRSFSNS
jgi:hypothetical protein